MTSEQVAAMGYSNGCQGVQTCICPRETICADDVLSMIFLTIARASAWFSYPLYMLLFLSKANNLNNFLQKTALRCWINFSDYHHVHSLFGIIVGFEGTSHSFFHILRWARRNDDIQVCISCVYNSPSLTLRSNFFFPLSSYLNTAALDKSNGNYRIDCHRRMSIHRLTHDSALSQEANVI